MRSNVMGRIVWKETRHLLVFFFVMLVLAGILQAVVTWTIDTTGSGFGNLGEYAYGITGGFAVLFAAACGATLFATEKEERTFQTLQLLPISSRQLLSGKLAAAIGMCGTYLVLALILSLAAYRLSDVSIARYILVDSPGWFATFVATFGLGVVEFFAWSLLFSVLSSSPLTAALLGIFFASAGIQVSIFLTQDASVDYSSIAPYLAAWKFRAAIAGVVLLVSIWLASDWLHTSSRTRSTSKRGLAALGFLVAKPFRFLADYSTKQTRPLLRMSWQTIRESSVGVAIAYVVTVAFGIMLSAIDPGLFHWTFLVIACASGFIGLAAFSADQKNSSWRFLAARGVSPLMLWFSRVIPWAIANCVAYLVYFVLLVGIGIFLGGPFYDPQTIPGLENSLYFFHGLPLDNTMHAILLWERELFRLGLFCGYLTAASLLCLSAGQLISLLVRSRLLAAVAMVTVCIPLVFWLALMMAGGVPVWWSVLPIGLSLFVAGWLATRSLLFEHSLIRRIAVPTVLVAMVTGCVVFAVCRHRVNEIPVAIINFDPLDEPDPDPDVLAEIKARFDRVTAKIDRPARLDGQIREFYPVLLSVSTEPANMAEILWQSMNTRQRDLWRQGIETGKPRNITELLELTDQFLDNTQQQLIELRAATDFAFENVEQILYLPPRDYRGDLDASPLPRIQSVWELLELDFYRNISRGDAATAWQDLQTMARFKYLDALLQPDERFWYGGVMDHFDTWTFCENQTPELLDEAFKCIKSELCSVPKRRLLEYEHRRLIGEIEKRGFESYQGILTVEQLAGTVKSALRNLPTEKERSRRLIDAWTCGEVSVTHWIDKPEWMSMPDHKAHSMAWARTTFLPAMNRDGYILGAAMPNRSEAVDLARQGDFYWEQEEMLRLQNRLIRHKLETGQFPKNLDSKALTPGGVHYFNNHGFYLYPDGLPQATAISLYSHIDEIPPNTPFIANRLPTPWFKTVFRPTRVLYPGIIPAHRERVQVGYFLPKRSGFYPVNEYEPDPMFLTLERAGQE